MALVLRAPQQLDRALATLKAGLPVALPTETVYGLAANGLDPRALAAIFALKARPNFDPLILHVLDIERASAVAEFRFELERSLARAFWPGPLTLLLERRPLVPDLCTAGLPTVALRVPSHPVFREVLSRFGGPLAAPSANRFGRVSPTSSDDVVKELGPHGLEAVVEGGRCDLGVESSIVRVESESSLKILRPGALSLDELRAHVGPDIRISIETSSSEPGRAAVAPGTLESHYAPRCPLFFVEGAALPPSVATEGAVLLSFAPELPAWAADRVWKRHVVLSPSRSDREAAAKLFQTLRAFDGESLVVAERLPESGLGLAVNDRLRRAGAEGRRRFGA